MKPKTMILLAVALTCGLGASYMTSKLLAERKGPAPEERVAILIANTSVPKYTVLTDPDKYFEAKWRLKSEAPGSYFSDLKEIKDKRVNKEFKADVHISPEDVADKMSGLPIPDGFGSAAIAVSAKSAVGYLVKPGDKVEVILTQKGDQATSATILTDVLVLSVGDQISAQGASATGTIQAQTVNLAVKSDQAQLVRLAETVGELSLFLQRDGEKPNDTRQAKVTTIDDLKRAGRQLNLTGTGPTVQPTVTPAPTVDPTKADPAKLPFGLNLAEIEKAKKAEEKEPEVKPIEPVWKVTVERGGAAPLVVPFYKASDGTIAREDDPALANQKLPEKKPEKKQ